MTTPITPDLQSELSRDLTDSTEFGTNVGARIQEQTSFDQPDFAAIESPEDTLNARRLPCNVGRTEQKIRVAAGTAMLAAAIFAPLGRTTRVTLGILGAMELVTGSTRYCPLWQAIGVDTNRGALA